MIKKLILMVSLLATPVVAQNYYFIEQQPSLGQLFIQSQRAGVESGLMLRQQEENDILRHRLMMMEQGRSPSGQKLYTLAQARRLSKATPTRRFNYKGGCVIRGAWTKHPCNRV